MSDPLWKSDPIAVDIHNRILTRLEMGQNTFGPWKQDTEVTIEDALEEASDQIIYVMRQLIQIKHMIQKGR